MSAFEIESCFGAEINVGYFDIYEILDLLGVKEDVVSNNRVQNLIKKHGENERIVAVAIRQVLLDLLAPALESVFLPFDPYFSDDKLQNTKKERLYDAQERFLILCLSIANGRSVKSLKKLNPELNTKELRQKNKQGQNLFRYFREMLNEHTREFIQSYKARMEAVSNEVSESTAQKKEPNDQTNSVTGINAAGTNVAGAEAMESASADAKVNGAKKNSSTKLTPTTFANESTIALKLFQDGKTLLSDQVERFKRGESLDMLELMKFCHRLIESHTRNNFSLMAIRNIKDASTYLGSHSIGMAVLGIHFAKALKLSNAYVEGIALGALLFDLGRFRLPVAMIMKSTKMTDSEFDLFRKHIQFGEQILSRCEGVPKIVHHMLVDHHEKIDGTGYPIGKQGQEISVYGKMAAIIDAYDAMTSEQSHKKSIVPIQACRQMKKESGTAFDAQLLSVFLKSIGPVPVGSCVLLSNGRIGFVLTLDTQLMPALIRQVYSMTNKAFIASTDVELGKSSNLAIQKEIDPQAFGLLFSDHVS
ncbi:HD-GYP domain-containing protein [Marinomonas sp. IMCC 4694]|uniref:HD-GYP domain-containing protein n=1 Tax=Marinomonas sp. IMCC 4694 TaxID=2605432 RepID=UPI0011E7EB02|nr:HD domain-containing phosphohydrolase [Marinomonas sp. IMCC 4694]TYL47145.1 HD domain-containing protein [Marinomonas sp. IMCC 4694]